MKFEIGDGYKTRDGRNAGIYWIGDGVIHGWYAPVISGERHQATWLLSGRRHVELKASTDLMPKPEPLRECYFAVDYRGGVLGCDKYKNNLTTKYPDCDVFLMREVRDE